MQELLSFPKIDFSGNPYDRSRDQTHSRIPISVFLPSMGNRSGVLRRRNIEIIGPTLLNFKGSLRVG